MSSALLSQLLTLQSYMEIQAAVNRLKCDKAPGIYGIHAELLKAGGNAVLKSLHAVLCYAWNTGIIPIGQKVNIGLISNIVNFHPIDLKFEEDLYFWSVNSTTNYF